MARALLLLVLFWLIARSFWRLIEGVVRGAGVPSAGAQPGGRSGPVPVKMAPCPVCGTFVVPGKALTLTVGGQPVYFCSETCRAEYQSR